MINPRGFLYFLSLIIHPVSTYNTCSIHAHVVFAYFFKLEQRNLSVVKNFCVEMLHSISLVAEMFQNFVRICSIFPIDCLVCGRKNGKI